MATQVRIVLNQQQLELLDRTVEELGADSRGEIVLRALQEYATENPEEQ
jgi:metal-responsive CopG/Arc/MetJ family transcriptional regulator